MRVRVRMAVDARAPTTQAKIVISRMTTMRDRRCTDDESRVFFPRSKSSGATDTLRYTLCKCSDSTRNTDHIARRHTSAAAVKGDTAAKKVGICWSMRSDGMRVVVHMKRRKKSATMAATYTLLGPYMRRSRRLARGNHEDLSHRTTSKLQSITTSQEKEKMVDPAGRRQSGAAHPLH